VSLKTPTPPLMHHSTFPRGSHTLWSAEGWYQSLSIMRFRLIAKVGRFKIVQTTCSGISVFTAEVNGQVVASSQELVEVYRYAFENL
jgi:hypothetical protein